MISNHQIYNDFLSTEGLSRIRNALLREFEWFTHWTPCANIDAIRANELLPKRPHTLYTPESVSTKFDGKPPCTCLAPLEYADKWCGLSHHEGPFTLLVLPATDLPELIGLDWTYPISWNHAEVINSHSADRTLEQIFLSVVHNTWSFACYERIPAENLLLWNQQGDFRDQSNWVTLV